MSKATYGTRSGERAVSAAATWRPRLPNGRRFVHRVTRDSGWVVGRELGSRTLAVLLTVVLARAFTREQFGNYSFVLSVVGIAAVFGLPGIAGAITQSVARGYEGTFRGAIRRSFLASGLGSLLLLGFAGYSWLRSGDMLALAFCVSAVFFPGAFGLEHWIAFYTGRRQFDRVALHAIGRAALMYGGAAAAVVFMDGGVVGALFALFALHACANAWHAVAILRRVGTAAPAEEGSVRYGTRTSAYSAVNKVANHIDQLAIFYFISPESLAVYAVATRLTENLKSLIQSVASVLVPRFAGMDRLDPKLEGRMRMAGFGFAVLIAGLAIGVVPWAVPLIYGPGYADSVIYCQALLLSVCIGLFATLKYTFVRSKLDWIGYRNVTVIPNAVRIGAVCALVPTLGTWGAVLAAVVYRVSNVIVTDYALARHRGQPAR